jgi:hypothetical protein
MWSAVLVGLVLLGMIVLFFEVVLNARVLDVTVDERVS